MIIDDASFALIQSLLEKYAGIALGASKRQMVINRLSGPMRQTGCTSLKNYLPLVEENKEQRQVFINALTTNVTSFFREPHHYPVLARHLKGKLSKARIWSAGCSTGQEPYSILMHLASIDAASLTGRNTPLIMATDIDTQVLAIAKAGIYDKSNLKGIEPATIARFFEPVTEQGFRVKAMWRALIDFRPLNLCDVELRAPREKFDAIFCRNVMIYFGAEQQRRLTTQLVQSLAPNGLLFAGHSEMLLHSNSLFESLGQTVYRENRTR